MNRYYWTHRMWLVKYTVNSCTITQNILASQWEIVTVPLPQTDPQDWHYINRMQPVDVAVWEVIYYEAGVVGVYAAHDPYAEFYAVVPCASCSRLETWKTFWGLSASTQAQQWLKTELSIELTSQQSWVNVIAI